MKKRARSVRCVSTKSQRSVRRAATARYNPGWARVKWVPAERSTTCRTRSSATRRDCSTTRCGPTRPYVSSSLAAPFSLCLQRPVPVRVQQRPAPRRALPPPPVPMLKLCARQVLPVAERPCVQLPSAQHTRPC